MSKQINEILENNCDTFPTSFPPARTEEEKEEMDNRSIYVGNVEYSSTAQDLETHFKECGAVNQITILTNKHTGHPKGFAYIEFETTDGVDQAMALDESTFHGRVIKVMPKRTNIHGYNQASRPPRLGRGRGMGRFQPSFQGMKALSELKTQGKSFYKPY